MLSGQAPEFAISTHCRVFYRFGSQVSLLYHAPIRIKVVGENHPAGEKEQDLETSENLSELPLLVRAGDPCPRLRTQKIVGSRPCPKGINIHGWLPALHGSRRGQ